MHTKPFLSALIALRIAQAAPVTFDPRQQNDPNAPEICRLDPYKKESWQQGGGNIELAAWFQNAPTGEADWLREMDKNTTDDGSGNSNLDCSNINSNNCNGPTLQCKDFTPYNYYYVRQMASQVHGHLKLMHEQLQNYAIVDNLAIDKIISDFSLAEGDTSSLGLASSAFWLGGSIFGANPVVGGGLNAIGAIFGLLGASLSPDVPDYGALKIGMETYLTEVFKGVESRIDRLAQRVFGFKLDDNILDETLEQMKFAGFTPDPQFDHSPITRFLSTGAFMERLSESDVSSAIDLGFKQMKIGMIGNLLAGLNVHVVHNSAIAEGDCKDYGMRYVDGACDYLWIVKPGLTYAEKVDWQWLQKLESDYGFNIQEFYKNIDDCNNGSPAKTLSYGGTYPSCMFSMKVIKTSSKAGGAAACFPDNGDTLPETLKADKGLFEQCHKQTCIFNPASQGQQCRWDPIPNA